MHEKQTIDPDIYTSLDALGRLKYRAGGFRFSPRQPINSILAGRNVSKLRGRGLNFEEMRQYQVGDDIRTMDWKVTVRTGKPHVKVYTEERERKVLLLVDQRSSMFFGSTGKMKSVIASEVAALIAWNTLEATDKIGALIFNDFESKTLLPKRSHKQVSSILSELVRYNHNLPINKTVNAPSESLAKLLSKAQRVAKNNTLVILISDCYGWNDQCLQSMKTISQHNDFVCCHVTDPLEHSLVSMPQMVVTDGELQIKIDTDKNAIKQSFENDVVRAIDEFLKAAKKYRVPLLPFNTIDDSVKQLRQSFGANPGIRG